MSKNGKSLYRITFFVISTTILFFFTSCIIVKKKKLDDEFLGDLAIMEKPQIPLSDQIVRSPVNDMIASIPLNWFFIDTEEKAHTNIFSVSCNHDYSMCALFLQLTQTQYLSNLASSEGLVAIARYCYEQKFKKSHGNIELIGDFLPVKNGKQKFYVFTFKNKIDDSIGKSAVFISSLNNFYEFSLLQLTFKTNELNKSDFEKNFHSILASIKF